MLVPKLRFKRDDGTEYPEWGKFRLEDTVDFLDEKRKPITSKDRKKGQYPYYGASGIIDYIDDFIFDEELVLLSEDGANIVDRNYRVAFIAMGKYWVNNHAHCLRPKQGFVSYFISEALENIDYTTYNTGSAQPKLNQEVCRNLPLSCPCLEEQQKIADFLSVVDEVIAQSEAEVQNLEQQKKAAMQKIFSQEVRFKREDGTDYPEWEEKTVIDVATLINGRAYKSEEFQKEGKYLILRVGNLFTNDTVYYSDLELEADKYIDEGDLIYAWSATFGARIYHGEKCIYHYHIWKVVPHSIDKTYLLYALNNDVQFISSELNGGTMHHLTKFEMEQRILFVPCLEEQQKIADFLSAYDEAISYVKQELDKWKELKKGLLQQMFV